MRPARKVISTVLWLGRGTATVTGLAVLLALTVGMASTALAGTGIGARFDLGKTNMVNAISSLVGGVAGPSLKIDNNSTGTGATALPLEVEPGKTPMKVDSGTKVANLNADRLDGKGADHLVRVASFTGPSALPVGADGRVATAKITAPAPGFLVVDASSNVINTSESDLVACSIEVDNKVAPGSVRQLELNANQFVNRREVCSANTVVPVAAGTHTIDLEAQVLAPNTRFLDTALSAIYIPFGRSGVQPSSAAREQGTAEVQPSKDH